jgi:2-alkenal reductase
LGDADRILVGQIVVALGSPFGQQGSMSLGIVSGLGRSLESQRQTGLGGTYSLPQVIQTDAPINPGNSGGPLLNLNGEVIGVNSAIRTTTGINSGVGFAIPVSAVTRIAPVLITEGSFSYPYMGISASGTHITLDQQEAWGLPQVSGVYVGGVTEDSPAEEAGLVAAGSDGRGGDLITAVDGLPVRDFNELISYLVFEAEVGQTIRLTVVRDGETLEVPLILGERP